MRAVVVAVVALIGGFLAGIVLSEVIGVVGLLVFEDVVGIKFLPVVTALVAAAAAVVVSLRAQRRSGDGREAR
jgi:O-antigen ligase